MKFSRITAAVITAALSVSSFTAINASADGSYEQAKPVFTEYNDLDMNGAVIIEIPENITADVDITVSTPEIPKTAYYDGTYDASTIFMLEGNDDRSYSLSFSVTDTELELGSSSYTENITIPDLDYEPDSWTGYRYVVNVEQKDADEAYDLTSRSEEAIEGGKMVVTEITFYIAETFVKGDVDEDGNINALDASMVLTEYAAIATQKPSTLTDNQKKAADVNEDGVIDALDASLILTYYSDLATGKTPSWD